MRKLKAASIGLAIGIFIGYQEVFSIPVFDISHPATSKKIDREVNSLGLKVDVKRQKKN